MRLLKLTTAWALFWASLVIFSWSGWILAGQSRPELQAPKFQDWLQLLSRQQARSVNRFIEDKVPVKIAIPKIQLSIEIVPGVITNQEWQVSETKANYLIGSGVLSEAGNVVIYAHERPRLFGELKQLQPGDLVKVSSQDLLAEYVVVSSQIVAPTVTEVLEAVGEQKLLTLYTCSGWQDKNRLVVRAQFVRRGNIGGLAHSL